MCPPSAHHVLNAFKEGELERDNNNVHFLHVNGVKKPVPFYRVKGYAINDRIRKDQIAELRQLVQVAGRAISNQEVPETAESQDLLNVVVNLINQQNV